MENKADLVVIGWLFYIALTRHKVGCFRIKHGIVVKPREPAAVFARVVWSGLEILETEMSLFLTMDGGSWMDHFVQ